MPSQISDQHQDLYLSCISHKHVCDGQTLGIHAIHNRYKMSIKFWNTFYEELFPCGEALKSTKNSSKHTMDEDMVSPDVSFNLKSEYCKDI